MRVYREPDAFPAENRWLRKAVADSGARVSSKELESRAEAWRPWRAYAAILLWDSYLDERRQTHDQDRRTHGETRARDAQGAQESESQLAGQVA